MQTVDLGRLQEGFRVVAQSRRSQAATMVIPPSESTGGPDNRHPDSDQCLLVLSGSGEAVVGGETVRLRPGVLLLIEAGETHEIRSDDGDPLETVNFYSTPQDWGDSE